MEHGERDLEWQISIQGITLECFLELYFEKERSFNII